MVPAKERGGLRQDVCSCFVLVRARRAVKQKVGGTAGQAFGFHGSQPTIENSMPQAQRPRSGRIGSVHVIGKVGSIVTYE